MYGVIIFFFFFLMAFINSPRFRLSFEGIKKEEEPEQPPLSGLLNFEIKITV